MLGKPEAGYSLSGFCFWCALMGDTMETVDRAIENAAFSLEMEGFVIDEQCKTWCRQLLCEEITMEQYICLVQQKNSEKYQRENRGE